jgi:HEAT repeat protein
MITRGFAAISLARLARSAAAQPAASDSTTQTSGAGKSAAASSLCDELMEAYRRTKNIEPEGMIVLALGLLGDERAEPFIRNLLVNRRTRLTLKGATALSLGLLKDTDALDDLLALAQKQQDEPLIIPHITLALGMLGKTAVSPADRGNEKSVEMLVKLWDKAQKNIFGVAYTNIAVALTMLGKRDEIVLPRLKKDCAKDADIAIRPFALHTLGLVGTREMAQIFIDLYENETNDNIRNAVVYSIGFFMDKSPAPQVTRIMADNNHSLFTWVVQHLLPMPQW